MKDKIVYMFLWIALIATVLLVGNNSQKEEREILEITDMKVEVTPLVELAQTNDEMKGVWVTYIDLETAEKTEEAFKENFNNIVKKAKDADVNSLFVHVRPFSDALYKSEYFPWSHILTGTQGQDPNFDPLEYMIDYCHSEGLDFHAWVNPMRVSLATIPTEFSTDNPYSIWAEEHPYYFIETDSGIYLNPAYKEVRQLIANGVAEISENYEVDGIHFDDYFYPENMSDEDKLAYDAYKDVTENPLSIADWREANINSMVSLVYRTIKNTDSNISFGISPQANLNNNKELFADVETWCSVSGYIDYICPQIYFSYDNKALAFLDSLDTWMNLEKLENLKIYIGLGLYKVGTDSDGGTWLGEGDIIANQIEDVFENNADGYILYSSGSL